MATTMPASAPASRISQRSTSSTLIANSHPPELLIIVRPPPSSINHPSNVQIQVITPAPRARASVEVERASTPSSFDAVAGAVVGGGGLTRSSSITSSRSGRSPSSSVGSGFGGGSGRRVSPLYNLEFHSIQTTVVTDAGTDAKVAKFLKNNQIELLNFAVLDPTEISPPTSPSLSLSRSPLAPLPQTSQTLSVPEAPSSSFLSKLKRLSFTKPSAQASSSPSSTASVATGAAPTAPLVPLFPEDPASHRSPPNSKGYTFSIRKWLRSTRSSSASTQVIRFEWRRGPRKSTTSYAQSPRPMSPSSGGGGVRLPSSSRDRSTDLLPVPSMLGQVGRANSLEGEEMTTDPNNLSSRSRPSSMASGTDRSRSPAMWESSSIASSGPEDEGDEGYESDPEDSDRPWVCELVMSSGRRVLLGTLTPAPHHPKLVATLAVPFDLGSQGVEGLSVEEMKDVVSVTCLWIVVRESLGGLGKRRKGDGAWRLR